MKLYKKNLLLIILAIFIAAAPLAVLKNAEFEGADGLAMDAIGEIVPDYEPWMNSLLFSLQAAIGAGVVGFVLGRMTSKKAKVE